MRMKHNYWVLGFSLVSFIVCAVAVMYLPNRVVIHWNMQGEADGYGTKYIYLMIGSLGFLSYFLMGVTKSIDPNSQKIEKNITAYTTIRDIVSVMLSSMGIVSVVAVTMSDFNFSMFICVIMGGFLAVLGNYLPRVPHNYFMGVKTPWAIADEMNWKKTQRVGGYSMVVSGLMMVLAGLFNLKWLMVIAFSLMILLIVLTYIYSWYIYKHDTK